MTAHQKDWPAHLKSSLVGLGTGMGVSKATQVAIESWGQGRLPEWVIRRRAQVSAAVGLGAGLWLWKRKGADYGGVAVAAAIVYAVEPLLEEYLQPRLESFFEPASAAPQLPTTAATVEQAPEQLAEPTPAPEAGTVVDMEGFRRR